MFKLVDSIVDEGKLIELGASPDLVDKFLGYDNTSSGISELLPPTALLGDPEAKVQQSGPKPADSTDWFQTAENLTIAKTICIAFFSTDSVTD